MFNILFVCTGNVCRSPMAEYILKDLIEKKYLQQMASVESGGTEALEGYPAAEFAAAACERFRIYTTPHRARSINPDMMKKADLILCMGEHHKLDLIELFPQYRNKIFLLREFGKNSTDKPLTIEDPYGGPRENYVKTFLEIREEVFRVWPEITSRIEEKSQIKKAKDS